MSRRRKTLHRSILPDPRYKSTLVTELVGVVLKQGKKTIAERIVYTALEELDKKVQVEGATVMEKLDQSLDNIKPRLEVKTRRVGGANYQVPIEVAPDRAKALALRWLLSAARKRSEPNMALRLAAELQQARNNEGAAVRKKIDTHKMAEANKAFAHYKW
jgi:small subunit ribosomal protein S7